MSTNFEDILYDVDGPVATITINRPTRYNAFRAKTVDELIAAFNLAWGDRARPRRHPDRCRRQSLLRRW